jgi:hypothetical protein
MEKNTKILLGLAAAGVVVYLATKPKKAVANASGSLSNFWNREAHLKFWKKIFG